MQQTFKTLNKQELTIDSGLIEPFDFSEMLKRHYILADQFHIKAFIPKELTDAPHYDASIAPDVHKQTAVYNKLMYDPATFQKLLDYTDEILKRPEYFLLRLPALFNHYEIKQQCTTFTLGSLLESWKYKNTLHYMDDEGETRLVSILQPRLGGYSIRTWSTESNRFKKVGIHGSINDIIEEFEQLNKRYPVQLKENDFFASKLLEELL